ncbi:hypothetical protein [Vulcanococcus sp.]
MLVKSGTGSFSMVGGFVLSAPPQHGHRYQPAPSIAQLIGQLIHRFK